MRKKNRFKFQYLFVSIFVLLQISCATSRRIEKESTEYAYKVLDLQQGRKDNVELYKEAAFWMHVPYRNGGLSKSGIDCSGLVYVIYKNVYTKTLERNSAQIFKNNCKRKSKHNLREGDLLFFNTGRGFKSRRNINHVGIYLKDDKFLHASSSRGVIVSDLNEDYYRKACVCGGRVR